MSFFPTIKDTDSVIFKQSPGDFEIATGSQLGCLTDEVPQGKKIVKYRAAAPKTYGLLYQDGSEELKMKGITLCHINRQIFNFNSFSELVAGQRKSMQTAMWDEFCRVKHRGIIFKRPHTKTVKMTFSKRVLLKNKQYSIPYGYQGALF
jgi:hypothetical protein